MEEAKRSIPLIHITDLYHPPQDPDDHVDLATVMALEQYDVRAIILDVTTRFLIAAPAGFDRARDPGYVPVQQLVHLTGRPTRVATGPSEPLRSASTGLSDLDTNDRSGAELILHVLRTTEEPVVISIVGSARSLAVAYNTDPEEVRRSVGRVLLNAGSSGGDHIEWNVGLDPNAYVCLWHRIYRLTGSLARQIEVRLIRTMNMERTSMSVIANYSVESLRAWNHGSTMLFRVVQEATSYVY